MTPQHCLRQPGSGLIAKKLLAGGGCQIVPTEAIAQQCEGFVGSSNQHRRRDPMPPHHSHCPRRVVATCQQSVARKQLVWMIPLARSSSGLRAVDQPCRKHPNPDAQNAQTISNQDKSTGKLPGMVAQQLLSGTQKNSSLPAVVLGPGIHTTLTKL